METLDKRYLLTLAMFVPQAAIAQEVTNNLSLAQLATFVQPKLGLELSSPVLSAGIIPTLGRVQVLLAYHVQLDLCAIKALQNSSLVLHPKAALQEALELLSAPVARTQVVEPV